MYYKHLPRTGEWATADVAYATVSVGPEPGAPPPRRVLKRWSATGTATFHPATWQQLPTLVNIVNELADLDVVQPIGAGMTETLGSSDASTRILR